MIKAQQKDRKLIVDLLTAAFEHNPSVNYIIKQDNSKQRRMTVLMEYSFWICYYFGDIYLSDDRKACALVLYPDRKRTTWKSILQDAKLIFGCVGPGNITKVLNREKKIKAIYPQKTLYYLWFIGVDPVYQGKGAGSSLLRSLLDDARDKQRPVYLETSVLSNIAWYEKFGFHIYNELEFSYKLFCLRNTAAP